jgi:hypothetical protein
MKRNIILTLSALLALSSVYVQANDEDTFPKDDFFNVSSITNTQENVTPEIRTEEVVVKPADRLVQLTGVAIVIAAGSAAGLIYYRYSDEKNQLIKNIATLALGGFGVLATGVCVLSTETDSDNAQNPSDFYRGVEAATGISLVVTAGAGLLYSATRSILALGKFFNYL